MSRFSNPNRAFLPSASLFCYRGLALAAVSTLAVPSLAAPVAPAAPAASGASAATSSQGGSSTGTFSIIGPDDALKITVLRHPEFSAEEVVVSDNGLIALPVVGSVRAAGKTAAQLDAELTKKFKVRLLRPEVVVSIIRSAPRPIYVVGEIKTPGVLAFRNGWRITQALAASGGLTVDSDLAAVAVSRGKKLVADVPLLPILRNPSGAQNLQLRIGDTLRFYERVVKVNISGAVTKPGIYPMPRGSSLVDAIGLAGGPTDSASLTRATLRRSDGTTLPLNLYNALRLGEKPQDVALRDGDVLSIPESRGITVLGEVNKPDTYKIEEGLTPRALDALARAGGTTVKAESARISITRTLPDGKKVLLNLDPIGLLELSSPEQNALLQDGDIISVSAIKLANVTIGGLVKTPGNYPVQEGDGLTSLLAQAGSVTEDAALSQVVVTSRAGESKAVNAIPIVRGAAPDIVLRDGDKVFIPRNDNRILVAGAVNEPNSYPLPEDRVITIGEALGMAKGAMAGAGAKEIVLWRETPQGLQRIPFRTDKPVEGQFAYNQKVRKGDVILVPEGKTSNKTLGLVNSFLPALSLFLR